jgi:hypothetical protein
MRSEREGGDSSDQELYEFLDGVLREPAPPAPPGVEERYQEMIRAHFARQTRLPSWRSMSLLVACVSVVLVLLVAPRFSPMFGLMTVVCAGTYAAFLRVLAGWEDARPA